MSATLNVNSSHVAHGDNPTAGNPRLNYFAWLRRIDQITVKNPRSEAFVLEPGQSKVIFDGARLTLTDATVLNLTLSTVEATRYRLAYASGTVPAFRTDRAIDLTGRTLTLDLLPNASLKVTSDAASFGSAVVGDIVFIPHTTTGDSASPFNVLNVGYWRIQSRTTTELVLVRLAGQVFEGSAEVVTVTAASQFQVFSAAGVQIGDKLEVSGSFPTDVQKTFVASAVTASWVEFTSTTPLPTVEGGLGGGIRFFASAKRFLRIETDQESVVQLNGSTDLSNRLSPLTPADPEKMAWFEKFGSCYSLTIRNLSSDSMNVNVLTAE